MKLKKRIQIYDRRLRIPNGNASMEGVELDYYWARGEGEPVVFLHGGVLTDWFGPLANELSAKNYRIEVA
jgi:hypothetical protein